MLTSSGRVARIRRAHIAVVASRRGGTKGHECVGGGIRCRDVLLRIGHRNIRSSFIRFCILPAIGAIG